ncbi:unnamed protein product [Echinostoma caproni]|uniref:Uncharacterized protein n=1 Tax=Echinostoma caproni TaxID=27848 RepID=A0A3P8INW4_9TREM|nr:unnamed protein product [Echinostoma caproni]
MEDHNVEAVDMLLKMPGISWKNYRRVMEKLRSLHELAQCSLDKLIEILDSRECATKLFNFLHNPCDLSITKGGDSSDPEKCNTDGSVTHTGSKRSATGTNPRGARLFLAGRVKTNRGRGRDRVGGLNHQKP